MLSSQPEMRKVLITADQSDSNQISVFSYNPESSFVRSLSKHQSLTKMDYKKCEIGEVDSKLHDQVVGSNLGAQVNALLFENITVENPVEVNEQHEPNELVSETSDEITRQRWKWKCFFCFRPSAGQTPDATPVVEEATVVSQQPKTRTVGIQTSLVVWTITPNNSESTDDKKEENPEGLLSRRGDIPTVVSNGNRPTSQHGMHQYYRASWRLKPSVIGASETLGVTED